MHKTAVSQFYSLFREAMFANKLTAADVSARRGVHYTYIYNSVRNNANLTLDSAQQLAAAVGYDLHISFTPTAGSEPLVGNLDPHGSLFSRRKRTTTEELSEKSVEDVKQDETMSDLNSEIEALLAND